jgi:cytoskeleton protein RodZ
MSETVGQRFKRIRLSRHLTIDQVFQVTHIRPRFLDALENDDRDSLPSVAHSRGFIRLYADFLGLPAQTLLDAWEGKNILESEDGGMDAELPSQLDIDKIIMPEGDQVDSPGSKTSEAIFREIGLTLRHQRETVSISLQDLEQHLHIRLFYLQALEEGRFDDLPSLAQGRGMLNNYAHFLELNVEALLLRFAEALQARREEKTGKKNEPRKQPNRNTYPPGTIRRLITPDLLIGSLAIILFASIIVWTAARVSAVRQQQAQVSPLSIAEVLLLTPSLIAVPDRSSTPFLVSTLAEDAQGELVENPDQIIPTGIPLIDDLPLQVYVVALQRSWMRVISDGRTVYNGRITPGNAYPFSGKDKIELTTGNAAGIQVYFNQNNLGSLGVNSQVENLVFSQQGLQTSTIAATPTPTITNTVSVTPTPTRTLVVPTATVTPYVP